MDDQNVIRTMEHKRRFGRLPGIKLSETLLAAVGNPQKGAAFIHIAGTNGKGSTAAFLREICTRAGIRTGLFTSPHLIDFTERIQVDKHQIPLSDAARLGRRLLALPKEFGASMFDYCLAIALLYFKEQNCGLVILETGLGGRLDTTIVIAGPAACVITSISLEHTEILGDTLEQIAAEKAGIIKEGVPVIFDGNEPLAEPVIRDAAKQRQAPLKKVSWKDIKILLNDGKNIDFSMDCGYDVTNVRISFPAKYQVMNAALALAAVPYLSEMFEIAHGAVCRGLERASWPGRMEETEPEVYMDGAHNVSGIQGFLEAVCSLAKCPSILLFSMVQEKAYEEAVRLLCRKELWEGIILTKISDNPRALDPEHLKSCFIRELSCRGKNIPVLIIENPGEAFQEALKWKKPGQTLFCAGSLYLIGELKTVLRERKQ